MRLEPVLLLAPEPARPVVSRRRFLVATWGGVVGGLCGGVALSLAGVIPRGQPEDPGVVAVPEPLRWAVGLSDGPLDRLLENDRAFLVVASEYFDVRDSLWQGVRRIAEARSNTDPLDANERASLRFLVDMIDSRVDAPREVRALATRLRARLR